MHSSHATEIAHRSHTKGRFLKPRSLFVACYRRFIAAHARATLPAIVDSLLDMHGEGCKSAYELTVTTTAKASNMLRLVLLLGLSVLAGSPSAHAVDPHRKISQYGHAGWRIQDGAITPGTTIAQTTDGYIWLGTTEGLMRFDGVTFTQWQPPKEQSLLGAHFTVLFGSRDGSLWIGTTKGLSRWQNGQLRVYSDPAKPFGVGTIIEDRSGTIWFTRYHLQAQTGPLCSISQDTFRCFGKDDGIPASYGLGLTQDGAGDLWFASRVLYRWRHGSPAIAFFSGIEEKLAEKAAGVIDVAAAPDGTVWATLNGTGPELGVRYYTGGKWASYIVPGFDGQKIWSHALLLDREGSLWVGTENDGIYRIHGGVADHYTTSDGLSGNAVALFYEDREGNIWVRTNGGLDMFRNTSIITYTTQQGLSTADLQAVLALSDGSVWVAGEGGVDVLRRQGDYTLVAGRAFSKHDIWTMLEDHTGRIWLGEDNKLLILQSGQLQEIRRNDGKPLANGDFVCGIAEDADHTIWVITKQGYLFSVAGDRLQEHALPDDKNGSMKALAADRNGGIWIGFETTSISHYYDGRFRKDLLGDSQGAIDIHSLSPDDDSLLVSTSRGLYRWKEGQLSRLATENGLPCDLFYSAIKDNHDALWLHAQCGLLKIDASEVAKWAVSPHAQVRVTIFDARDGARAGTGSPLQPRANKAADGRLWFITGQAAQVIDPDHLYQNAVPPPVLIENVVADHRVVKSRPNLQIAALTRDLRIDYTALSFSVPQKVRFRYMLQGHDRGWQDAGTRRQAFYSNLPPGKYVFLVTAANNDGVWNETGASLDFSVLPAYYQTAWFRALCAAAFLASLWTVYRLRIRQLRRQERKLRDVIETIPTFAWTVLPNGSVDFVNRNWQEYTGLSSERTVGLGWQAAVHAADLNRHAEKWRASLASGEPFENEVRYRRAADGQYRWFLARAIPLRDQRGKILKWYGISTDIDDRKRAEQEREQLRADLAHVNRVSTLGELAASMSHELKQPITAAMTNAGTCILWLKRDQPDVDEALEATMRIVEDGTRATEIIDRLRSLYKKSPPQRELVEVNAIIHEMVELLRAEGNQYAVSIRTDLVADLPPITADRVQLQQVFMNLILNAIEAMKETGGVLTVKTQLGEHGQLLISVSDTGVGLPKEKTEQIFDAFFTTKPQGSGMGLSISRSIVESHGGHLWATANNGRGATFHFTLPTAAEAQSSK